MDKSTNATIKKAFQLVYGNKNFKIQPLKFGISDTAFINFISAHTDITVTTIQKDNESYYIISDIKQDVIDDSIVFDRHLALMVITYLDCEIRRYDRKVVGYIRSSTYDRIISEDSKLHLSEFFEGEHIFNYNVFFWRNFNLYHNNLFDDQYNLRVLSVLTSCYANLIDCEYTFETNCYRYFRNDVLKDGKASKIEIKVVIKDCINFRTNCTSKLPQSFIQDLINEKFENKIINDSCYPTLAYNPTLELIAAYIITELKDKFICDIEFVEVKCNDAKVKFDKLDNLTNLINFNREIGQYFKYNDF